MHKYIHMYIYTAHFGWAPILCDKLYGTTWAFSSPQQHIDRRCAKRSQSDNDSNNDRKKKKNQQHKNSVAASDGVYLQWRWWIVTSTAPLTTHSHSVLWRTCIYKFIDVCMFVCLCVCIGNHLLPNCVTTKFSAASRAFWLLLLLLLLMMRQMCGCWTDT